MISSWCQALRIWGEYWISRCADPKTIEIMIEEKMIKVMLTRGV
jgi:hypothetical protein